MGADPHHTAPFLSYKHSMGGVPNGTHLYSKFLLKNCNSPNKYGPVATVAEGVSRLRKLERAEYFLDELVWWWMPLRKGCSGQISFLPNLCKMYFALF